MDFIRLDMSDNVVMATRSVKAGTAIEDISTLDLIPAGHKIATSKIAKGNEIRKYAQLIGYAARDIPEGSHVHTHNVACRNTDMEYEFCTGNLYSLEEPVSTPVRNRVSKEKPNLEAGKSVHQV